MLSVYRLVSGKRLPAVTLAMMLLLLSACASMQDSRIKKDDQGNYLGTLLIYDEREAGKGQEMFMTEILILPHRMRISDNLHKDSYILVDRDKKIIYNVNASDKTVMKIQPKPFSVKSPIELDYKMDSQPSGAIPKISEVKAMHYKISVNGQHCYDTVTAGKEFHPEITAALSEFRQILAGEHAKSLGSIPKDLLDGCDLALNIFHSTDHLAQGFPLREWDRRGYLRFIRFWRNNEKIKPEVMELPSGYETYSIP